MIEKTRSKFHIVISVFIVIFVGATIAVGVLIATRRHKDYDVKTELRSTKINGETKYFLYGTFTINVNLHFNKETAVSFIIPSDKDGNPVANAANIIFYAPFNGEDGYLSINRYRWLTKLSLQDGFTIFSLRVEIDPYDWDDHRKYYVYEEAGWYDVVFKIQHFLQNKYHLRQKKLSVLGQSSGGAWTQRMIVAYPERFLAGACHGAKRLKEFTYAQSPPPILLSTTSGDATSYVNRQVLANANPAWNIWYMETSPKNSDDRHSASADAINVMCIFLRTAILNSLNDNSFKCEFEKTIYHCYPQTNHKIDTIHRY